MKKIELIVKPGGDFEMDLEGFEGKTCLRETEEFLRQLGGQTGEVELKSEAKKVKASICGTIQARN